MTLTKTHSRMIADAAIDPVQLGADPTGVTDSHQAFLDADIAAAALGNFVFIQPGTYKLNDDFRHKDGSGIKSRGWIGAGPESTILEFDVSVADARLLSVASTYDTSDLIQRGQKVSQASPDSDLGQLNPQETLSNTVTLTTLADNTKFAVGNWVSVSCGHDPYDANGWDDGGGGVGSNNVNASNGLWRYSMVTRITAIDTGTGEITLADAIQQPLTDDGFAPGSARDIAPDWADSTVYAIGDLVYDPLDTPVDSLWEAATAGTSSGTSPRDDTVVTWLERSTGIGTEKGDVDGRPVIQNIRNPRMHVVFRDFSFTNIGTVRVGGIDFRNCYGCRAENVVARGNVGQLIAATEASFNIVFRDVLDMTDKSDDTTAFSAYAAHNVLVDNCTLSGSALGTQPVAFVESGADVSFRHTTFNTAMIGGHTQTAISPSHGTVLIEGCKFYGFEQAITQNEALASVTPSRRDIHRLATIRNGGGNHFEFDAAGLRRMWSLLSPNQNIQLYAPGNTFRFTGNVTSPYTQTDPILFEPTRLVEYVVQLTPLASQADVVFPLPTTPEQGIFDIEDIRCVFLGCRVKWDSAPASGEIDIIPRGYDGTSNRRLLASANPVDRIRVTDVQPTGQLFKSNGTTNRLIDNNLPNGGRERIQLSYVSNASAGSGTIYVTMMLLVEEGFAGDFEG